MNELPIVIAGSANGRLKTGGNTHNQLTGHRFDNVKLMKIGHRLVILNSIGYADPTSL